MLTSFRNYSTISKTVRSKIGRAGSPYPIIAVDGFSAPKLEGKSYFWTTISGKTVVHHPNAYGYPTLYHASTLRIVVGKGWLISKGLI